MVRVQRQMRRWNHGNFHYPIIYIYIKRNNYRSFVINLQYRGNNFVISRARVMRVLFPLYRNIEMCISCIDYVQLVDNPISLQRDYLANLKRNECVDRYWNFHKKSDSLNIVIFCTILYLLCIISRIFLLMIKETSIFFEYYNTVLFYILLLCIEYIIPFPLPCFNKANCPFAIFFFFSFLLLTNTYTHRYIRIDLDLAANVHRTIRRKGGVQLLQRDTAARAENSSVQHACVSCQVRVPPNEEYHKLFQNWVIVIVVFLKGGA